MCHITTIRHLTFSSKVNTSIVSKQSDINAVHTSYTRLVYSWASILLLVRKQRVSFDLDFLSDKNIAWENIWYYQTSCLSSKNSQREVLYFLSRDRRIHQRHVDSYRERNSRTSCFRRDIAVTEELRMSVGATSTWCCAPRASAWGSSLRSSICRGSTGKRSASRRWPCRSPSSGVSAGSTPMSTSDRSGDTRATAASRSERGVHLEREGSLENAITKIREDRASSPAETNPARGPLSPLPSASLPRIEGVGRSQGSKRRNATKVISINIEAHALSKSGMDPPRSHPRDDPSLARSALFECRARELFAKQLLSLSLGFGVLPEKVLPDYREANNEVTS